MRSLKQVEQDLRDCQDRENVANNALNMILWLDRGCTNGPAHDGFQIAGSIANEALGKISVMLTEQIQRQEQQECEPNTHGAPRRAGRTARRSK